MNEGDRYGPYDIIRLIGRGAMGDVFLAHNTEANRTVALKVVNKVSDREVLEAERLGAELQTRLRGVDSRVVAVNAYGELAGDLFIEMEFIDGEDVSSLISRGPVNPEFAAKVAGELCEMLENLRAFTTTIGSQRFAGIVHGDLKPGNVRIDRQRRVKVLDFGIAKALTHTRKYTMNVFASTAYCSPERIETQNMDMQSDLWSVGVLLYQMVSCGLPFDEPTKERLERRIRSAQAPNALPASCPESLQRIVYKMLARDAGARYPSPRVAGEDLTRFQSGDPVLAVSPVRVLDNDATVRTSPPVRSAQIGMTPIPKVKRSRRFSGCLLTPAIFFVVVLAYGAMQVNFWDAADKLKGDLQAERIANLDQAWTQYQTLNKRSHLPVLLWGTEHALKNRLVSAADETISEYRNSDAPALNEPRWIQARNRLAHALELSPGDNQVKGRLRLCEGHIDRIDSRSLRGTSRQKKLNASVNKFYEAADLLKHWPDPYLGLASVYIYDLADVDRAEDALKNAAQHGHRAGNRETAQLADGYRGRADRMWRQSRRVMQMPGEERDYLTKAKQDYLHAENLYGQAGLFGDTLRNKLSAMQGQQRVEARLSELDAGGLLK